MMSWIALVWTIATICISLPHIDLTIFIQALNPFNIFAFVTQHPLVAGAVSLAFLAPTGLEMMYADVSHISVVNMRKTATVLVFWAIIIYTAQAGFISTHYAGQVLTDFS